MLGSNPSSDRPTEGCVDARCVRLSPRGGYPPRGRLFCFRHALPLRVLPETRTVFGFCDCAAKQSPHFPGIDVPESWLPKSRGVGQRPTSSSGLTRRANARAPRMTAETTAMRARGWDDSLPGCERQVDVELSASNGEMLPLVVADSEGLGSSVSSSRRESRWQCTQTFGDLGRRSHGPNSLSELCQRTGHKPS